MKKLLTYMLSLLGLTTACGQQGFEETDVKRFAELIAGEKVIVLDVRTANEFNEAHLEGAQNIDVQQGDFVEMAKASLPTDKTIAVYCHSGRRSLKACEKLAAEGYRVVNLKGGITAWLDADMPTTAEAYEMDVFPTKNGKSVRFYALMHGTIRMNYDGVEIYVDPVRQLGDRTIDYTALPKAEYILVTHEHGDHYDAEAIRQLCFPAPDATEPLPMGNTGDTWLITNKRCAEMYGAGEVMANGDKRNFFNNDFTVEAVPAYNTTAGREKFHPKGRDNGYILTLDGLRIYIAGDTEDIPEMAQIKDIDVAFLPCNQPYTMTTDQLVKAAKVIKPKVLFPYHYGQTDLSTVAQQLEGDGIDVRIRHYE